MLRYVQLDHFKKGYLVYYKQIPTARVAIVKQAITF